MPDEFLYVPSDCRFAEGRTKPFALPKSTQITRQKEPPCEQWGPVGAVGAALTHTNTVSLGYGEASVVALVSFMDDVEFFYFLFPD